MITDITYYKLNETQVWRNHLQELMDTRAVTGSRLQCVKGVENNGVFRERPKGDVLRLKLTIHYENYDRTQEPRDGTGIPRRRG